MEDGTDVIGTRTISSNVVFSPDACTMFYSRRRDVYFAERSGPSEMFGVEIPLTDINTGSDECRATISPDGRELLFTTDRGGVVSEVFRSRRDLDGGAWPGPIAAAALNRSGVDAFDVSLAPHGLRIYYALSEPSSQDLAVAQRDSLADLFGPPVLIAETMVAGDRVAEPSVTANDRVLTYATIRASDSELQLYYATRADWNDPWVEQGRVPGALLDAASEREGAVSPDGCELMVEQPGGYTRLVYQLL